MAAGAGGRESSGFVSLCLSLSLQATRLLNSQRNEEALGHAYKPDQFLLSRCCWSFGARRGFCRAHKLPSPSGQVTASLTTAPNHHFYGTVLRSTPTLYSPLLAPLKQEQEHPKKQTPCIQQKPVDVDGSRSMPKHDDSGGFLT